LSPRAVRFSEQKDLAPEDFFFPAINGPALKGHNSSAKGNALETTLAAFYSSPAGVLRAYLPHAQSG
jgi:hypothetical protein